MYCTCGSGHELIAKPGNKTATVSWPFPCIICWTYWYWLHIENTWQKWTILSHPFITIQHHIACMIWYRMTWDAVQLWSLVPSTHIGLHYRSTSRLPYMISTISDQQIGNKTWKYYCTSSESCPTTWSQSASRHYTFIFFPPGISPEASPLLWDRRYADLCCAAIGSDPTAGMERQGCKYLHEDECHEDENSQTRYAKWYWIDVLKKIGLSGTKFLKL